MNVTNLIGNIKTSLDESGLGYFADSDILEVIQDGYDEVATLSGCIENSTTHPQISDLIYYNFGAGIPDFYSVTGIWNTVTKRWLTPRTLKEARNLRYDWECWEGDPANFFICDSKYVAIFPVKSVLAGSFIIFYNAIAEQLTMTAIPRIPAKHFDILENYAMAALLEQSQEFGKAAIYFKDYLAALPKVKEAAKVRASADRMLLMGDSMPRFAETLLEDDVWIDNETPTELGLNTITIAQVPVPSNALYLFRSGVLLFENIDYVRSGTTITLTPGKETGVGIYWRASYRVG